MVGFIDESTTMMWTSSWILLSRKKASVFLALNTYHFAVLRDLKHIASLIQNQETDTGFTNTQNQMWCWNLKLVKEAWEKKEERKNPFQILFAHTKKSQKKKPEKAKKKD